MYSNARTRFWVGVAVAGWLGCAPDNNGPRPPAGGAGGEAGTSGSGGAIATGGSSGSGGAVATGGSGGSSGAGGAALDAAADTAPAGDASPPSTSTGCGQNNPGGTFMIMAGANQTPYRVVLPSTYDPTKPYPVVFYLHGRGNNIEGQANLTRDVAMANLGIVVYPKSFASSGWETPGNDKPVENLALLRALIKKLGEQYCVDSKRIIMSGFSSGCWFASRLACQMKDELAAVVVAGCGLDPMGKCPDRKPITYIIGRSDPAFSGAATAAEFYRNRNTCQMTRKPAATAPCEAYDGCAPGMPTAYCLHPGGHMWPGFASQAIVELLQHL
jgi:polyhydroxybutyrate depolymerase